MRNLTPRRGPGKLRNYWEEQAHVVVSKVAEDAPIYEIKPEQGKGRSRVLHRNLLMPCDHLPLEIELMRHKPKRKQVQEKSCVPVNRIGESELESENESQHYVPVALGQLKRHPSSYGQRQGEVQIQPVPTELLVHENESDNSASLKLESAQLPLVETEQDLPTPINIPVQEPAETGESSDVSGGMYCKNSVRQRRPPKRFTYDSLGTSTCYKIQITGPECNRPFPNVWTPAVTLWVPMMVAYRGQHSVCL